MLAAVKQEKESILITRSQNGDCAAFEELIIQHRSGVTDFIFRLYGDEDLADDAAQTAFIQAWRNLHRYEPRATFRSWLFKIAMNAALDHLRREKPMMDIDKVMEISQENQPDKIFFERQRILDIQQAVAELPDASRSVLVLKEFQEMRYQEIAEILEIPIGTVMSRLNYARKLLAGKLSMYLEEE